MISSAICRRIAVSAHVFIVYHSYYPIRIGYESDDDMELLAKTALTVIVIVAILSAVYLVEYFLVAPPAPLNQAQANSLVVRDLMQHSPGANVSILNSSPSSVYPGSWNIFVRLVYNQSTACPSMTTESFIYPATGFLNTTSIYSNYSNGTCRLYMSLANASRGVSRIIGLAPLAIDVPYNDSISGVVSLVDNYGYANVMASAHIYNSLNIAGKNMSNVWLVTYTSPQHNTSYYVVLNTSGDIIYKGAKV
ncbi:hypothetical protein B2A_07395 [mine drainage metagenome]|uniref:Uncharacterized protein n=1 Tax=mine drainage metagenome TaxID=410659 RepID=T1BB10_9ZZZZ